MELQNRLQIATEKRKKGYNCAQSVLCPFADRYGISEEILLKISEGFGGGIAGSKGTCGAVTAMVMLVGLENADGNVQRPATKQQTYKIAKGLMDQFEEKNGSIICRELKGIETGEILRSCDGCINDAIEIFCKYIDEK